MLEYAHLLRSDEVKFRQSEHVQKSDDYDENAVQNEIAVPWKHLTSNPLSVFVGTRWQYGM